MLARYLLGEGEDKAGTGMVSAQKGEAVLLAPPLRCGDALGRHRIGDHLTRASSG
jgi:hypothetical protein